MEEEGMLRAHEAHPSSPKDVQVLPLAISRLSLVQLLVFATPTDLVLACYYRRRTSLQCGVDKGTLRNDFKQAPSQPRTLP